MHDSSYKKAKFFMDTYYPSIPDRKIDVMEVGSKSYHSQDTYKNLFNNNNFNYTGLDIEEGNNVDFVPKNIFVWNEIEDNKYDLVISGQTFEHNPYFWITFAEIARVLKPGGHAFICAPGSGKVHRYPVDCWRFYPDSWSALCQFTGMELLESYFEPDAHIGLIGDAKWRDSAVIARKPILDATLLTEYNDKLRKISGIINDGIIFKSEDVKHGKWVKAYEASIDRSVLGQIKSWIRRKAAGSHVKIYKR